MNLLQIFAESRAPYISPRANLVYLFPPSQGLRGASTTLRDLWRLRGHEMRREAARAIFARNMADYVARGKGSKAAKREARIRSSRVTSSAPKPIFEPYQPMKKRVNFHE